MNNFWIGVAENHATVRGVHFRNVLAIKTFIPLRISKKYWAASIANTNLPMYQFRSEYCFIFSLEYLQISKFEYADHFELFCVFTIDTAHFFREIYEMKQYSGR